MLPRVAEDMIAANREAVSSSFRAAEADNRRRFLRGDATAGSEYIFPNQMADAINVVSMLYEDDYSAISVIKKTKVGANGFMIALAHLMTTHPDPYFVINPDNVRFLTGMSSKQWEHELKNDLPTIFKDKVFHHGALKDAQLGARDSIIFIDEFDTGSDAQMVLENTLRNAGVLDINYMKNNNIRFVVISATMTRELYQLYRWGKHHGQYRLTIPANYIGQEDFIKRNILREFYPVNTIEAAVRWITEDLVDEYKHDFRVGIIRTNSKNRNFIQHACMRLGVDFKDHTSTDRIDNDELKRIFETTPRTKHMVIAVKGLLRRATLIPNRWKKIIGPVHEAYGRNPDANVQTQGLPGRMTGYWRDIVEGGHKTGPFRTSLDAIEQSINAYSNPYGTAPLDTRSFKKKKGGEVQRNIPSLAAVDRISGLNGTDAPIHSETDTVPKKVDITSEENAYLMRHVSETSWDEYRPNILKMIERHSPGYLQTLPQVIPNVICPGGSARDKIIGKMANACTKGQQYNWNDNQVKVDTYKIYVDTQASRLFISVCRGSKRAASTTQHATVPTM